MIKRDWLFASLICAVIYRAEYKSSLLARTRHLQHALTDGLFINEYIISLPLISWVTNYVRNRDCLTFFLVSRNFVPNAAMAICNFTYIIIH